LDFFQVAVPRWKFFNIGEHRENRLGRLFQGEHARVPGLRGEEETDPNREEKQENNNAEQTPGRFHVDPLPDRRALREQKTETIQQHQPMRSISGFAMSGSLSIFWR